MTTDVYEHLKVEISEGIATVILNRAEKRNAVNRKMLSEMDRFFSSPSSSLNSAAVHRQQAAIFRPSCSGAWIDLGGKVGRQMIQ